MPGIGRFVQVSAIGVDEPVGAGRRATSGRRTSRRSATPTRRCGASDLAWTIIRPGRLTDDPPTGLGRARRRPRSRRRDPRRRRGRRGRRARRTTRRSAASGCSSAARRRSRRRSGGPSPTDGRMPGVTSSDGQRLMVLDTASMYFRAFFGVPEIKAADGTNVNAVRGLLEFIARLVTDYSPSHLVCAWDNDWRPQWRVDLLPSYKAHRVEYVVPGRRAGRRGGPRPARGAGADHPRGARGPGHLRRRRRRLRGRRRHRHPRHRAPTCPSTSSPATATSSSSSTTTREVRVLYIARGVGRHERVTNSVVREKYGIDAVAVRRLRHPARRRLRRAARRRGRRARRRPPRCWPKFGDIAGVIAAARTTTSPSSGPARAARSRRPRDYLAVAPQVVAVARDIDLGAYDATLPRTPADHAALVELSERWNLESPLARVVEAMTSR